MAEPEPISRMISPIKVTVKLKDSQYVDYNKWAVTIHGEKRIATLPTVQWYCVSFDDALTSFNKSEIKSLTIEGNFDQNS
jgi:hypothetical protein